MIDRRVGQQRQLVPALAQGDEQREQRGAHEQPMADGHGDSRRAGRRAQREPGGDRQHVENDDVLQERRVGDEQHDIRRSRLKELPAQCQRRDHRRDAHDGRSSQRECWD